MLEHILLALTFFLMLQKNADYAKSNVGVMRLTLTQRADSQLVIISALPATSNQQPATPFEPQNTSRPKFQVNSFPKHGFQLQKRLRFAHGRGGGPSFGPLDFTGSGPLARVSTLPG